MLSRMRGRELCKFGSNRLDGLPAVCGVGGCGTECGGRLIGQATLATQVLEVLIEARLGQFEAEVVRCLLFKVMRFVDD